MKKYPFMFPPPSSSWMDMMSFYDYMREHEDEIKKHEKERGQKKEGRQITVLEIFFLFILVSPFAGPAYLYFVVACAKYMLTMLNGVIK